MNDDVAAAGGEDSSNTAKIVYLLYLIALVVGITSIIGVVMAYINRKDAPEWLQTHYQYQIRTFWICLLYSFISALLTMVVIGIFLMLLVVIWYIIRCVKGMKALGNQEAIENPTSWMI